MSPIKTPQMYEGKVCYSIIYSSKIIRRLVAPYRGNRRMNNDEATGCDMMTTLKSCFRRPQVAQWVKDPSIVTAVAQVIPGSGTLPLAIAAGKKKKKLNHALIIILFLFLAASRHMDFPGQESDPSPSCNLYCSYGNAGFFNPPCQTKDQTCILALQRHCQSCCTVGTPVIILMT